VVAAYVWNNGRAGGLIYGVGVDQGSVIETATHADKLIERRAVVAPHHRMSNDPQPAHAVVAPTELGGLHMLDDPHLKADADAFARASSGALLALYGASLDARRFYVLVARPTGGAPGIFGDREKVFDVADAVLEPAAAHVDRPSTSLQTLDGVTYICARLLDASGVESGAVCGWNNGRAAGSVYGVRVDQQAVIGTATQAERLIEEPAVAAPH
jgi:hypothetical protein